MKQKPALKNPGQCRQRLVEWYRSPQGSGLRTMESDYLSKVISFRYNQEILQIGSVGWENEYQEKDCSYGFIVVDDALPTDAGVCRLVARCDELPIDSESIDVVVVPHCLEFEIDQHRVLREAERVLKPEGQFIVLGFNPWSFQSMYHFRQGRRGVVPWCGTFLSYPKLRGWLSLLNFETFVTSGVYFRQSSVVSSLGIQRLGSVTAMGYGINAIKRRYNLIPLKSASVVSRKLISADVVSNRYRSGG